MTGVSREVATIRAGGWTLADLEGPSIRVLDLDPATRAYVETGHAEGEEPLTVTGRSPSRSTRPGCG